VPLPRYENQMESFSLATIEYRPNESVTVPAPPVLNTLTNGKGICCDMSNTFPFIWIWQIAEPEIKVTHINIIYRWKIKLGEIKVVILQQDIDIHKYCKCFNGDFAVPESLFLL
jgi:hypothetical protein